MFLQTGTRSSLFALLVVCSTQVLAQQSQSSTGSDTGTNASPLTKPASPPVLPYDVPQGYLFSLRPLGASLGKALADNGIYITGRTLQQTVDSSSGGLKQGSFYEGFNLFGVDLDMNRIAGIKGGSIHLLLNDLSGLPYQNYSGSLYAYNRAFAYTAAARLNEFSYEQSFADGRVDIRVGRLPVGTEFDASPTFCEFIYGMCGFPSALAFDKGYAAYLAATTAGVVKVDLNRGYYANFGLYEDEPSLALQGHLGFPGEDWAPDKIRGVTIPMQFGYKTTFDTDPYPRMYDIGGYIDTGDYADPLANATGRNRTIFGGTARLDHGKSGLWLQGEQTIFRPDADTRRNLKVFANLNVQTSGEANINNGFVAGFSYLGPTSSRPNDTVNFNFETLHLNRAYTQSVDSNLALRGMYQGLSSTETFIELNYGIAIAPGMTLKPSFNYIWNPDQVGFAKPTTTDRHAVFIGLALSAFIPETLGLPRLGQH